MVKKRHISDTDIAAFHQAVAGTKPLVQNKVRLAKKTKSALAVPTKQQPKDSFDFSDGSEIAAVGSEEFIAYKQSGISDKTLRKLRKGQYNVEAILDLHGMSVEQARKAVGQFLQQCLQEKLRIVLIIHGKGQQSGMPILKNKLNHWLREINVVLAFCSANPSHGSRGAMYVLLKCTTEEKFT